LRIEKKNKKETNTRVQQVAPSADGFSEEIIAPVPMNIHPIRGIRNLTGPDMLAAPPRTASRRPLPGGRRIEKS